jgi:hypothetical protein
MDKKTIHVGEKPCIGIHNYLTVISSTLFMNAGSRTPYGVKAYEVAVGRNRSHAALNPLNNGTS